MKKMSKLISHFERNSASSVHYPKNLHGAYQVISAEDGLEKNRIVKKSIKKTVDPIENFKGIKVSDFYLENIIAVGAEDSLKFNQLSPDKLTAADNIEAQIPNVDAFIENNLNDGGNE